MDTNGYPSLPNLAQVHARLSTNSRRVETVVDAQLGGIEQLLSATIAEDWEGVAQATRYLAEQDPHEVETEIIRNARYVFEELRQTPVGTKKPKHLETLLAACRTTRKNHLGQ